MEINYRVEKKEDKRLFWVSPKTQLQPYTLKHTIS